MEEHGFDVEMLDVPVEGCREMQDRPEGFELGSGSCCFGEVDTGLLGKAFRHIVYLVLGNLTGIIPFPLAN